MFRRQKKALQSFRQAREFLTRNTLEISLANVTTQVQALGDVVDRLTTFQLEQERRTRLALTGTSSIARQVRDIRKRFMNPISRLARTQFVVDNTLARALALPRDTDPEGTFAAAMAMADAAETQKSAYLAAGFAADFAEQLRVAARALKAELDQRTSHVGRRQASTAGVKDEVARGRTIIALLDAVVAPELEDNPALLAEWRAIRRLSRSTVVSLAAGDAGSATNGEKTSASSLVTTEEVKAA